jgi:hypothetical protein
MTVPRGVKITDRDREILNWIGRHGIVTADQVRRCFFESGDQTGKRAALRRLQILESIGLIRRDATPFWRAPKVIRITTAGARLGEVGVAPARLVEGDLRHAVAVVDLVEELALANRGSTLQTERELRQERYQNRLNNRRVEQRGRCPDGLLILKSRKKAAIELDLTPKRTKDYERILRAYRQEQFDLVWWYVVPGAVARVRKLVLDNRCDDFVDVRPFDSTVSTAAG